MKAVLQRVARRGRRQRTLSSYLARTLVPRTVIFAALAAALLVGNAFAMNPTASPADALPSGLPTWTTATAAANPGCVPSAQWPAGRVADAVVGYRFRDNVATRVAFDRAWAANHNESDVDDVWVIGVCPGG